MEFLTRIWLISTLLFVGGVASQIEDNNTRQTRQKRLFSIFNIVTFKNDPCTTTGTENLGGTCLTSSDCTAQSGSASGSCAAGFGVCCLFTLSGACGSSQTVDQNCTYIRNDGYPSADMTVSQTCTYNFNRICDNLCQIRLDFRTLSTSSSATGSCGTAGDAVTVSSPFSSAVSAFPPTVCGILSGQHMYFETGTTGDAGTLSIATGTGAGSRSFDIKATYYTCDNLAKAPAGCTQYFTGESGSFKSYNHAGGQLLENQNYNHCFRQELGFCRLSLTESATMSPDPFFLSAPDDMVEVDCTALSFLTVVSPTSSMNCGGVFGPSGGVPAMVTTSPGAFEVGVRTISPLAAGIVGFNLDFEQVACA